MAVFFGNFRGEVVTVTFAGSFSQGKEAASELLEVELTSNSKVLREIMSVHVRTCY